MIEKMQQRVNAALLEETSARTPVVTGRLRAGWVLRGNTLANEVPYAGFVEERRAMLARGTDAALERLPGIAKDELTRALGIALRSVR